MTFLPVPVKGHLHRLYKKAECRDHQLLYLFLEITRACNLSCRHCGSDCRAETASGGELTTASWIKVLEYIAATFSPPPVIVLTGGEPLIHPDIGTIIRKCNALHLQWGLVSNGYCLDDATFKTLESNNIGSITISLDGTEKSHNWLRGKADSYQKAMRAIQLVAKSDLPQKDVVTCVNPQNLYELDAIAGLLIENKMPSWRLFRIFPSGRAKGNKSLLLSIAETRILIDWLAAKKTGLRKSGLDVNFSCEGFVPFSIDIKIRNQPFFCRSGVNIASILCDGTITGCSNNSGMFFEGNILRDDFASVWTTKFKQFRDRSWVLQSSCGTCKNLTDCQGGSLHLWRNNMTRPDFCYMDCFQTGSIERKCENV